MNQQLVELGPVAEEYRDDLEAAVRRHHEETESPVAKALLDDWSAAVERFTQVMPTDFRKVLEAKAAAEAAGLDEKAATEAMMEALHG